MVGFDRLHPHVQHAIIHDLAWRSLRPVQNLTIDAVLDGDNCVVLAPTAGGKTEAAMFPILSRILAEESPPVAALYVCPIRALLNNQEDRFRGYARMVGLDVFKWHGDVSDSRKRLFRESPTHILMTTPESLEVMLISARTDARALFRSLGMVVIDEVHAFAADDRGAHLVALIERLGVLCKQDIQRIGLSATVGNPHIIGQWLQGSSKRRFRLIDPPKSPAQRDLLIDYCDGLDQAAAEIGRAARGKKSLIFVESRSKAERVAHSLGGSGVEVFIHHSAISRSDRVLAEEQFASGRNTAIVCTSTMELGIDVGDLDQVIQLDAPGSVASFLQRLGRTGRRVNTRANCKFFCLSQESLLQSIALLCLAEAGWVEDVRPAAHAMHVLAHQVMALVLQEGGISRHKILPWVQAAYPFSSVTEKHFQELIDTMINKDILYKGDGVLSLGAVGEQLYGRKNFFELYAVFTAPPIMRVMNGNEEVGYVQALFVSIHDHNEGSLCFRLAGRAWEVVQIEWNRGVLRVRPADRGRVPTWLGQPGVLAGDLCRSMMGVLIHKDSGSKWLTPNAALELRSLQDGYEGLFEEGNAPIEDTPDGVQWHTFAGGAVNRLLAVGLEKVSGHKWVSGNLSIRCKNIGFSAAGQAISKLSGLPWEHIAEDAARSMVRGAISKFQPCLTEAAEARLLSERLLDLQGTFRFLSMTEVSGCRLARRPQCLRLVQSEGSQAIILDLPPMLGGDVVVPRNPVCWVDTTEALVSMVSELSRKEVVGLSIETTMNFGILCLLQVATTEITYLIDPLAIRDLRIFARILGGQLPVKIVHNARFVCQALATVGLSLDGVFDTFEASKQARGSDARGDHSLCTVCERELGMALDKMQQPLIWSCRPLSSEQLYYAVLDAEILIQLYLKFLRD